MPHILYTSHDCPFCARAISTLKYANINTKLRSSDFNHMPIQAENIKSNASIPLLIQQNNYYIDESWDIVIWALKQNDPDNWLGHNNVFLQDAEMLVETYDHSFLSDLKAYQENPEKRDECEEYLEELEEMLTNNKFLLSDRITIADISIVAFVRQLVMHDVKWFDASPYPKCRQWLEHIITTSYFKAALRKL